jgi:hypothetical protein
MLNPVDSTSGATNSPVDCRIPIVIIKIAAAHSIIIHGDCPEVFIIATLPIFTYMIYRFRAAIR